MDINNSKNQMKENNKNNYLDPFLMFRAMMYVIIRNES